MIVSSKSSMVSLWVERETGLHWWFKHDSCISFRCLPFGIKSAFVVRLKRYLLGLIKKILWKKRQDLLISPTTLTSFTDMKYSLSVAI